MQSFTLEKPYTCSLCGKTVVMYVGGYSAYHHPRCGEIGNLAIEKYHRRIAGSPTALEWLINDFQKVYEEIEKTVVSQQLRTDQK